MITERPTNFCKESYNKASMSSEISDILFSDTVFLKCFCVFQYLLFWSKLILSSQNLQTVMTLSVNLNKFLILRLREKVVFACWFFSKLTPIENHSWSTGIQNIGSSSSHSAELYSRTQYHKVLWTLKVFMTSKGNREKYWKKNPLKTMKYGDSIFDHTTPRAATY